MELRHLRYFATVVAEGGFGRASQSLRVAQPALSRQIKSLEKEVGVPLLERTPKGVVTTPAGAAFLGGAERVISAAADAVRTARRAVAGHVGQCRLGVGRISLHAEPVYRALAQLAEALPDVDILIEEAYALDQPRMISAGALDLGFSYPPPDDLGLAGEPWFIAQFDCALLPAAHPLAQKAELEPADLSSIPVLYVSPSISPAGGQLAMRALDRAGITSPREFVYTSPQSLIMVVASGRGWAPIANQLRGRPPTGTVAIPVRGLDFPIRVDLVWRRDETRPVVLKVRDVLLSLRDGGEVAPAAPPSVAPAGPHQTLPPALELRHLRYFSAVVDHGGFSRAAQELGLTQPSLSRQVADLEYHVGTPLLDRSARGVVPTEAGRILRESVRQVTEALTGALNDIKRVTPSLSGRCGIGIAPTPRATEVIAALTPTVRERWPALELVLEEYPTPRQPDALRSRQIDIGVCVAYPVLTTDPELAHERLVEDAIDSALVAVDHPLAQRGEITPADLASVPLLYFPREFHAGLYDRVYAELAALGLRPRVDGEYQSVHVMWTLAAQGRGWVPGLTSHRTTPPIGTVAVPVAGLHVPLGLDVLWRRRESNPLVAGVLEAVRALGLTRDAAPAAPPRRRSRASRRSSTRS